MKLTKIFFRSFLLVALLLPCGVGYAKHVMPWRMDTTMKFQLGYLPGPQIRFYKPMKLQKPLGYTADYSADVTNINLANFLALGFDVPNIPSAEDYNVYLKWYPFPKSLNNKAVIDHFVGLFNFKYLPNFYYLRHYIYKRKYTVIKRGFIDSVDRKFTAENPFPRFIIPTENYLVKYTPFYSLYVKPSFKAEVKTATDSVEGVRAFQKELLTVYKRKLVPTDGINKNLFYFIDEGQSTKHELIVFKIPKEVMVFDNWRALPMPYDPQHVFLSGLLLVYRTVYQMQKAKVLDLMPKIDSADFNKQFHRERATVLEVASVFYLPKPTTTSKATS